MKPKKNSNNRKNVIKIILLGLIVAIAVVLIVNRGVISDYILAINYQPTTEIEAIIDDMQLTDLGKRILLATRPEIQSSEDFNENCPIEADTATLGCYNRQRIYVYDVQNDDLDGIKQTVMAHELLHAAWNRLSDGERNELTPILISVYEHNHEKLDEHMSGYSEESHVDELHSVIGTELSIDNYPEKLQKHYARYFKQQSRIVEFFNQYNDKFEQVEKRGKELTTIIQQKMNDIDRLQKQYETELSKFKEDCDKFNARARTQNGFASREAFDAQRSDLILRQVKLKDAYEEIVALIDETNKLIDEYSEIYVRSKELFESIDSKTPQPAEFN